MMDCCDDRFCSRLRVNARRIVRNISASLPLLVMPLRGQLIAVCFFVAFLRHSRDDARSLNSCATVGDHVFGGGHATRTDNCSPASPILAPLTFLPACNASLMAVLSGDVETRR